MLLHDRAPAKVNLTLHVLGRRADGFHELDSIVAFAGCAADALTLVPGRDLALLLSGPFASETGAGADNLVLKAASALAERVPDLLLGRFALTKRIPVAAGLGGGSADAAAALRLLAKANGLDPFDTRLLDAAAATGSDVPACLVSRALRMTGRGETIEPLVGFRPAAAVLANPLKAVSTPEIFRRLGLRRGQMQGVAPRDRATVEKVWSGRNDLEPIARALLWEIGLGITALAESQGCRLARMSGSGATVFGLYDDARSARAAARRLRASLPDWWLAPTMLR